MSSAWVGNGYWALDPTEDIGSSLGGGSGSMLLLNVAEGNTMALKIFLASSTAHSGIGDISLGLSFAQTNNIAQTDQGIQRFAWQNGY